MRPLLQLPTGEGKRHGTGQHDEAEVGMILVWLIGVFVRPWVAPMSSK
jgi:hypothetical protein